MPENPQHMRQDDNWKRELAHILFVRSSLMVWTGGLVAAASLLIALFWPQTFEAESSVMVRGKRPQVSPGALDRIEVRNPEVSREDIETEIQILRSPELARRVLERRREELEGIIDHEDMKSGAVREFLGDLNVDKQSASNVLKLEYASSTPDRAEYTLNALLDEYLKYRTEVLNPLDQENFFEEKMEYYRDQLELLSERFSQDSDLQPPDVIDRQIRGNADLRNSLTRQLTELKLETATSSRLNPAGISNDVKRIEDAIEQLDQKTQQLQKSRVKSEALQRQLDLVNTSYGTFAKRTEEARINQSISNNRLTGDVSILSDASNTARLRFPRKKTTVVLGLIVGMVVAISVGFLTEFTDHTVRRPEDVERELGLPVIFSLRDDE